MDLPGRRLMQGMNVRMSYDRFRLRGYKIYNLFRNAIPKRPEDIQFGDMELLLDAAMAMGIETHSLGNGAYEFRLNGRTMRIGRELVKRCLSMRASSVPWKTGHTRS